MNYKYSVYQHIFPDHTVYVGLTRQIPTRRWGGRGQGYKYQKHIWDKINQYGWNNIIHEIVQTNLCVEDAQLLEQSLIKQYQSENRSLNIMKGGDLGSDLARNIEIDGKMYTSKEVARMTDIDEITSHDITTRINHHGWSIDKALTQAKMPKNQKYEYHGEMYTINELWEKFDVCVSLSDFRDRIHKGWDIDRALTQPKGVKKQPFGVGDKIYEYNGVFYNSYELSQMNPELGLKSCDITSRINTHHWSVEEAISTPKKKMNLQFEYNGVKYNSHELAAICVDPNMTYHDVTDRNRSGWSVWEIVNIPKGLNRKRFYNNK